MIYKYVINHLFLFPKCANWHTLLLSQISLTWLCLHQFAGFLWRHCLHPNHGHVSCGSRETLPVIHHLSVYWEELLRMRQLNSQSPSPSTASDIKMPEWNRKNKSCTWLELEKPVDWGRAGFQKGMFRRHLKKHVYFAFSQVSSPNLEQNVREDPSGRSVWEARSSFSPKDKKLQDGNSTVAGFDISAIK